MKYNDLFTEFQNSYEEYFNVANGTEIKNDKDIGRYIKNYLASYKSYIDGMKTVLSRSFGEKIRDSFQDLQKDAYENNFSYRFIYNLRNYAQHCGSPITGIKRTINKEAKMTLEVDRFLSEHTGMQKSFRKELRNFAEDTIDVGAAIKSVNNIIIGMQNNIINLMIQDEKDRILKASYKLMEFYNKNSKDNGVLYIANDSDVESLKTLKSDEPMEVNIKISQVPHQLAKFILENISMEFIFRGRNSGKSKTFPVMFKVQSVIEIPKFMTGNDIVLHHGIKWLKVTESIGFAYKDGYDRYAALYVPHGLRMGSYKKMEDRFKNNTRDLFV